MIIDCNSNFTCVVWRMKKLHTGSIFIFLEVAPLEVFASPPPDFLFWVDLDVGVALWVCTDGVGLAGLLSTGSLLGTSCFGASSGDGRSSSCWTKQIQRLVIRFAKVSHLLWKNMRVLRRIVIITSVLLSSTSDSFSPAARRSSFFSSWPDLLKLSLPPSSFSLSSCEYYDGNQISHLMNGELVILVKATACADLVIA